jgi:hypothetical protein
MPLQRTFYYEMEIPTEALEQVSRRFREAAEKYLSAIEKKS